MLACFAMNCEHFEMLPMLNGDYFVMSGMYSINAQ